MHLAHLPIALGYLDMLLLGEVGDHFGVGAVLLAVAVEGEGLGRVGAPRQLLELIKVLL